VVLSNQVGDFTQLVLTETAIACDLERAEPNFAFSPALGDMKVRRLTDIRAEKREPVAFHNHHSRHGTKVKGPA